MTMQRYSRKAQIQTQLFTYIMILVVSAGILVFGYNAISGFKKDADNVIYLKFETRLKNDFKSLSYGSIRQNVYDLPSAVEEVCFKGADAVYADVVRDNPNKLLIASAIGADGTGTSNNVFIYPKGDKALFTGISLDVDETSTDAIKFKCFKVNSGVLKITVKGQGKSVLVTGSK